MTDSQDSQDGSGTHAAVCPECGETFRADDGGHAMDYLIDHLTDAHGLFEWAVAGRPATEVAD